MEADLHLTDTQYLICLTVFFFSYTVFEVRRSLALVLIDSGAPHVLEGPIKYIFEASPAIHLAVFHYILLGNHDGSLQSARHAMHPSLI